MVIAGWLEPRQGMMTAVDRGRHRSIAEIGPSKSLRRSWEWLAAASEIRPRFGAPMPLAREVLHQRFIEVKFALA